MELTIRISGFENIEVPDGCKHRDCCICGDGVLSWSYCLECGLRSPVVRHKNGAWGRDILLKAESEGRAYRDIDRLTKLYCRDVATGKISSTLCYVP